MLRSGEFIACGREMDPLSLHWRPWPMSSSQENSRALGSLGKRMFWVSFKTSTLFHTENNEPFAAGCVADGVVHKCLASTTGATEEDLARMCFNGGDDVVCARRCLALS